ncbi:hypothetical protein B9Z19DRAFT_137501 [Tuber borchii]|uniref:Uncharacterized protein n=1 Tax=Tuber borchii TaxID=42251 RepID=A0A2T6ZQN5_TUBBO|nr:hypothetical protein B9Z19DRAFT_137501 [Tuber borchii]
MILNTKVLINLDMVSGVSHISAPDSVTCGRHPTMVNSTAFAGGFVLHSTATQVQVPLKKYLNIWTKNGDNTEIIQGYFRDISENSLKWRLPHPMFRCFLLGTCIFAIFPSLPKLASETFSHPRVRISDLLIGRVRYNHIGAWFPPADGHSHVTQLNKHSTFWNKVC